MSEIVNKDEIIELQEQEDDENENPDVPEIKDRSWIPLSQQVDLATEGTPPLRPRPLCTKALLLC